MNKQIGREEYEELLRRDLTSERNDLNVEGGEKPVSYTHLDVYKRQKVFSSEALLAIE